MKPENKESGGHIIYLDELPPDLVDQIQQLADEQNMSFEAMFNFLLKTGIEISRKNE